MTKYNSVCGGSAFFVREPRSHFLSFERIRFGFRAFVDQIELALFGAVAHARQVVGYDSQTSHSIELIAPDNGFIALHRIKKRLVVGSLEHRFNFFGVSECLFNTPHRWDASVN